MIVINIKTPLLIEGESIFEFIKNNVISLDEGDVLAITSKIVSLSEKRVGKIEDKEKLILRESKKNIKTPWAILTLTNDGWNINAGIDESNAGNKLVLLPKNPFKTAELIQKELKRYFHLKKLGVLITDTKSVPLRIGTVGRALGYVGFDPLKSYIGKEDLFGRKSRVTISNLADSLAAAAVLVMGEGNEQTPIAIIKQAPLVFTSKPLPLKLKQLAFPPDKDIFSKVFTSASHKSHKISKKLPRSQKL